MKFREFANLVPKDVDFRPILQDQVRLFGRDSERARRSIYGPDGFVITEAEKLQGHKNQPSLKVDKRLASSGGGDIIGTYRDRVNAWSRADTSKRGSRTRALQVLYWLFHSVREPSYFIEVAKFIWPTDSETFKRFVFAKGDLLEPQGYEHIIHRFYAPLETVEAGFHKIWFERNFLTIDEIVSRAGLEADGLLTEEINTPNLGIRFEQGGKIVPTYRHTPKRNSSSERTPCTTVVVLKPETFRIKRFVGDQSGELRNNIFVSIQSHDRGHRTIQRHGKEYLSSRFREVWGSIFFRKYTCMAASQFGSREIYLDDEVSDALVPHSLHILKSIYMSWNVLTKGRFSIVDLSTVGVEFSRIRDKKRNQYLKSGAILFFTFADFYNKNYRPKVDEDIYRYGDFVDHLNIDTLIALVV